MDRREFLKGATFGAAALAVGGSSAFSVEAVKPQAAGASPEKSYKFRNAFGCWMNDMRLTALPLENWPAPQLDDVTVESLTRTMNVQRDAGFQYFDVWGLFATFGWPADITSAVDAERRRRINQILAAAKQRGIKMVLGFGTYSGTPCSH